MVELKVGAEELLRSVRMVSELEGGVGLKVFGEALEGILAGWDGEGLELQRRWIEVERYGRELDVSMEAVAEGWSWEGDRNGDVLGDLKRMCNEVDAAYVELQQRIVDLRMECELGEHVLAVETESAERLRSKLAKERHARQEESQKRQKWKTEVGTRLKTSTRLLRDLRKDNAALVDNFEMRSEYRLDWQDRGERARDEIEGLRPSAEKAEQAVKDLEGAQKERIELSELLATLTHQAEIAVPFARQSAVNASVNKQVLKGLEYRLKLAVEKIRSLEKHIEAVIAENTRLQMKIQALKEQMEEQKQGLERQQDVSIARLNAISESNLLARYINGTVSRWILNARVAKQIHDAEADEDEDENDNEE